HSTGELLQAGGEKLGMISGALMAVNLLMAFMTFSSAHRSRAFDERLVLDGFPLTALLAAKLTILLIASALVSIYATVWMLIYWHPVQPLLFGVGIFASALIYGALGLFLALFLPGELEGTWVICMTGVIDLLPQNPVANPAADSNIIVLLPSYSSMQLCTSAGFTSITLLTPAIYGFVWLVGLIAVALAAFAARTRTWLKQTTQPDRTPAPAGS
ncbi:MAG: hypothetical protein ACRDQZ_01835, partial [Mycobacteriales bacterium]